MTEMQELAERLRAEAIERAKEPDWFDEQLSQDIASAAEAILTLERERDEAREANAKKLLLIQKLEKRIRNQRQNSRDNWEIVERRNKWLGSKASRDGYLRAHKHARLYLARATAAEAQVQALREALAPFASEVTEKWADECGWTEVACQNDRICDWFGPSDFLAARAALRSEP